MNLNITILQFYHCKTILVVKMHLFNSITQTISIYKKQLHVTHAILIK